MRRIFGKRGEGINWSLSTIAKLIIEVILVIALFTFLFKLYNIFMDQPEYTRLFANFKIAANEIQNIGEGESIKIPIMPTFGSSTYKCFLYPKGDSEYKECNGETCFCMFLVPLKNDPIRYCKILKNTDVAKGCVELIKDENYLLAQKKANKVSIEGRSC